MKKIYGLAALLGVAAGTAYYLRKVGALKITDEETEDGGHKYGVEVKLPTRQVSLEGEDTAAEEETEGTEEAEGEETAEEEERKVGFTFTVGPEASAKWDEVKQTAAQVKDRAVEAASNLKQTLMGALNRKAEETGDDFDDLLDEDDIDTYDIPGYDEPEDEPAAETVEEPAAEAAEEPAAEAAEEPAAEAAEEPEEVKEPEAEPVSEPELPEDPFEEKSPLEMIDEYLGRTETEAQETAQEIGADIDDMLKGLGSNQDGQF